MKDMEAFLLTLLHSGTVAHLQHWQTKSYSKHKALRKYYNQIIDLADELAESYMGKYEQVKEFEPEFHLEKEPIKYFEALQSFVMDLRTHLPDDSELQNLIDAIADLINITLYKLKNLE